ncbi:MAG: hypothetical protein JRI23_23010 [Deltaproteobacteria bacterium]|jgi:hypothetical protein|nr:hypothetical protein [Deltaproteobacteria bacterium]MBW2534842.1 hypothetical protein [Deltaproteobacteria bacterium]
MRKGRRRRIIVAAAVLAVAGTALISGKSAASRGFTLAMEDSARAHWDATFNKTLAEPFAKLECVPDKKMALDLGSGCVDTGDTLICCSAWTINVKCGADKKWAQKNIEGSSCETKPAKPES